MRRLLVSLCLCCLSIAPVAARMYQWRNPATGTTQMSGAPPAWYRSAEGGPRIYVFDDARLVDDTGIAVSDEQREALRARAFGAVPRSAGGNTSTATPGAAAGASAAATATTATPAAAAEQDPASKAANLKALIDAWDQRQLDQARSLLELLPPGEGGTAPTR